MNVQVVRAERFHLGEICRLIGFLYLPALKGIEEFAWSTRPWAEANQDNFYLACVDGKLVGVMCVSDPFFGKKLEIDALVVDPEFQGRGIGKQLIRFAKTLAFRKNKKYLTLGTFSVYDKVGFYEKQGFIDTGVDYFYREKYGKAYPFHTMRFAI